MVAGLHGQSRRRVIIDRSTRDIEQARPAHRINSQHSHKAPKGFSSCVDSFSKSLKAPVLTSSRLQDNYRICCVSTYLVRSTPGDLVGYSAGHPHAVRKGGDVLALNTTPPFEPKKRWLGFGMRGISLDDISALGGRYGYFQQRFGPDHPDTVAARLDHRVARIREFARELLADTAPPTDEQIESIVAVLRDAK